MKLSKSIFIGVIPIFLLLIFTEGAFAATSQSSAATVSFTETGSGGSQLSLDTVPALNFGSQTVSNSDEDYPALSSNPIVQVTDGRSVSYATGWHVTVSAGAFTNSPSNTTLNGAKITFNSGTPSEITDFGFPDPTTPAIFTITADGSAGTTSIFSAASGAGRGTWEITWPQANVTLHVPGGSMDAYEYTSTLTWTLSNTP